MFIVGDSFIKAPPAGEPPECLVSKITIHGLHPFIALDLKSQNKACDGFVYLGHEAINRQFQTSLISGVDQDVEHWMHV